MRYRDFRRRTTKTKELNTSTITPSKKIRQLDGKPRDSQPGISELFADVPVDGSKVPKLPSQM